MLDKQSTSTEPAPVWRLLRFFELENRQDKESPTAKNRPPKEPEERKHQFAVWYFFAAFLGVMLIQYLWVQYTQIETIPYSQFEQATLPGVDPVHKVSIIPRGVGALGYTMQRPTEDRFLLARHDLENRIAVLMGGRAAEALIFDGEVSTGASDDLQRATEISTEMVTRYGMSETLGPRTYARPPQPFLTGTHGRPRCGVRSDRARDRHCCAGHRG